MGAPSASTARSIGLIVSAYPIARLLTNTPAGRLADRFGRRPFLLGGMCFTAVSSIVCGHRARLCRPALRALPRRDRLGALHHERAGDDRGHQHAGEPGPDDEHLPGLLPARLDGGPDRRRPDRGCARGAGRLLRLLRDGAASPSRGRICAAIRSRRPCSASRRRSQEATSPRRTSPFAAWRYPR